MYVFNIEKYLRSASFIYFPEFVATIVYIGLSKTLVEIDYFFPDLQWLLS